MSHEDWRDILTSLRPVWDQFETCSDAKRNSTETTVFAVSCLQNSGFLVSKAGTLPHLQGDKAVRAFRPGKTAAFGITRINTLFCLKLR